MPVPIWPTEPEPDISIIEKIATEKLHNHFKYERITAEIFDLACFGVEFFAQGGFNKIFSISAPSATRTYLFRVSLPIEPAFKTESEAATISFLKANTTIPVSRLIAWDSDSANELGYEWIMLEKIDGVTARSVWRRMPWYLKLDLVSVLAKHTAELRRIKLPALGSIYIRNSVMKYGLRYKKLGTRVGARWVDIEPPYLRDDGGGYMIGHMLDQVFFSGERILLLE